MVNWFVWLSYILKSDIGYLWVPTDPSIAPSQEGSGTYNCGLRCLGLQLGLSMGYNHWILTATIWDMVPL